MLVCKGILKYELSYENATFIYTFCRNSNIEPDHQLFPNHWIVATGEPDQNPDLIKASNPAWHP
jgi:hypothetical protein